MHELTAVGVCGTAFVQFILAETVRIRERSVEQLRTFNIYTCQL
jgi:hypothetical protein